MRIIPEIEHEWIRMSLAPCRIAGGRRTGPITRQPCCAPAKLQIFAHHPYQQWRCTIHAAGRSPIHPLEGVGFTFFFALYVGWPSVTIVRWYRCVDMESSFLWKFGLTTSVTFELVKTRLVGLEKQRHIFTLIWILVCNNGMVGCCCLKAPSVFLFTVWCIVKGFYGVVFGVW